MLAAATTVTDLIRNEHRWFREQFANLLEGSGGGPSDGTGIWRELADRLEVHAAAEEAIFYPALLKVDDDAKDETKDAVKDHNEIRDGIREAARHSPGSGPWWKAVTAACSANDDHMKEEEEGPLSDFERDATDAQQRRLGSEFTAFHAAHADAHGVDTSDKDPAAYVRNHS